MTRAEQFIELGRQRLKEGGIRPTNSALVLWLAQFAVNLADATSSGHMRAAPPVVKPPKPRIEAIE
jgi:hypothetical protein